jgi:hypothetical protein
MRGVGSLATDRIGYGTVVIDVCLVFNGPVVFLCNIFPFPVSKARLIGDWYENRRGAPITIILLIIRQCYWRTDAPCANRSGGPNMKIFLLAHCAWSPLPLDGGGHRCSNILAHRSTLHAHTTSVRKGYTFRFFNIMYIVQFHIAYWRTEHFGAPCLFSSQSPIYCALQTGKGNTLRKRRRSPWPRSESIFEQ